MLLAGKHVTTAQAQKKLPESKVEAANNSIVATSVEKTIPLVMDFVKI